VKPLTIGVNALYLIPGGVGGTEIYVRELVNALFALETPHRFLIFTNRETGPIGEPACVLPVGAVKRPERILFEQLKFPRVLREHGVDVLLNAGFTSPLRARCPQVTVFHDLQHRRHPEYFRALDLPAWRFLLWAAARRSRRLIAVSPATRDDLLRFYPFLTNDRIDVVPHGVDPRFAQLAANRSPGDFLLCPSTTHPHKNHLRLLRCFARLREEQPGLRLVLTGVQGFRHGDVAALAATLGDTVEMRGWIDREELYELYRTARAVVYPTTFEGFGMPILEALAARVPLACSGIEPVRTLAAGAAVFFDPSSDDSLLDALHRVLHTQSPPEHAASGFTWTNTARLTLDSLLRAAS